MKKNIRKIPDAIHHKLRKIDQDEIVACFSLKVDKDMILAGELRHLGITFEASGLVYPKEHLPEATRGRFSRWNIMGREIKRRDLPKEIFYTSIDVPNWGDYSKGTHTVNLPRERYPVDYSPPRHITLLMELLNEDTVNGIYLFRVIASEVLSKNATDFHEWLFFVLNLLQENLGGFDVMPSGLTKEDYLKTHVIGWEILPPGNRKLFVNRLFAGLTETIQARLVVEERYDFLESLGAKEMVFGTSGLQRYFGAKLDDNLVVFENLEYGNAMYIMYEDWESLSQKSRVDLLTGRFGENFDRVIHSGEWQDKVRNLIRNRR